MFKNIFLQLSTIVGMAAISLTAYAHNSEITHSHYNAELIILLLVAAAIAIGIIKK